MHYGNKNLLYISDFSYENGGINLAIGRINNYNGEVTVGGKIYTLYKDNGSYMVEKSLSDFSGHLYGSEFQGIDFFGYYDSYEVASSDPALTNAFGFAGYLNYDVSNPVSAGDTTGTLALSGYANSVLLDSGTYIISSSQTSNLTYEIARDTGYTQSGMINIDGVADVGLNQGDGYSSYINDNFFATTKVGESGGWFVALDNMPIDYYDALAWGYYFYEMNGVTVPAVWVAGSDFALAKDYINSLPTNTVLTYEGKIMGVVNQSDTLHTIKEADSEVKLIFTIGNINPLGSDSHIKFGAEGISDTWTFTASPDEDSHIGSDGSFYLNLEAGR